MWSGTFVTSSLCYPGNKFTYHSALDISRKSLFADTKQYIGTIDPYLLEMRLDFDVKPVLKVVTAMDVPTVCESGQT